MFKQLKFKIRDLKKYFFKYFLSFIKNIFTQLFEILKNPIDTIILHPFFTIKNLLPFDEIINLKPKLDEINNYPLNFSFENVENPTVSIIIAAHNHFAYNIRALYAILKNTQDVSYEVIFADDASTDKTKNIDEYVKNIVIVKNEENAGFLKTCNNASKTAKGKYILLLNNDTVVQKGWLKHLVDTTFLPDVAAVGPMFVYSNAELQEAGSIVWSDATSLNYGKLSDAYDPEYNYLKEVDYVSGACLLVKKSVWDEIGGFDEKFDPCYFEDSDLCFEIRKRGFKVLYQPKSLIIHYESRSLGNIHTGMKRYININKPKFFDKWKNELKNQFSPNADIFLARDKSQNKKTILVIVKDIKSVDKDKIEKLIKEKINIKILPADFKKTEPETSYFQQLGVEVLYGIRYRANWKKWLKLNEKYFEYAIIDECPETKKFKQVITTHTNMTSATNSKA